MKRILLALVLIAILLIPYGVALASDITSALYHGIIRVSNNGTATENVSTVFTLNSSGFVANGFANSTFTDVVMQYNGDDVAFMPSVNTTYPWALWVPAINAEQNIDYDLHTANATDGKIRYFPGSGGMTVADNTTLELGSNFTIEQKGWIQTTFTDNYTDRNLVYKQSAFRLYVSASGDVTATITGGASVTATGVTSDERTIKTWADRINLYISIDDATEGDDWYDSMALGGVGVPGNDYTWYFFQNNVMPYVEYLKLFK